MPVANSLFCFTSNEIDSHFCPDCRAPMLVQSRNFKIRTFQCFNCARVVAIADECRARLSSRPPRIEQRAMSGMCQIRK